MISKEPKLSQRDLELLRSRNDHIAKYGYPPMETFDDYIPRDGFESFIVCRRTYHDDGTFDVYSDFTFDDDASNENGKRFNAIDDDVQYIKTVIPVADDDADVEEIDAEHPEFKRFNAHDDDVQYLKTVITVPDEDPDVEEIDDELTDLPEEVKQKKQKKRPKKKKQKERNKFCT
jgi:hypothetical protein